MKCRNCGEKFDSGNYCPRCGIKVSQNMIEANLVYIILAFFAIVGLPAILLSSPRNKKISDTKIIDMTNPEDETEYGAIYYSPIDEDHITSLDGNPYVNYIDDEILVVVKDGTSREKILSLAQSYDADIVGEIEVTGDYQLKIRAVPSHKDLTDIVEKINNEAIVDSASLNYVSEMAESKQTEERDGFYYGKKWQGDLQNFNDAKGKSWGLEAIGTLGAWDKLTQTSRTINPVRIGLIDTGFDLNHKDLQFAEVFYDGGANGLTAGYVTHGTHVAGTMAAKNNDTTGICGVYPYGAGRLYGVSNCNDTKGNPQGAMLYNNSLIEEKVSYAELIVRNIKVINSSRAIGWNQYTDFKNWYDKTTDPHFNGFSECSDYLGDFFQKFIDKGYDFVIVSSAGNNSRGLPTKFNAAYSSYLNGISQKKYPDVYDRIIVVGAVDYQLNVAAYSNGGDRVDIYAPGGDKGRGNKEIYSTIDKNKYDYMHGTSMAAPHVAGVAAMVWTANNSLTGAEVKKSITRQRSVRCTSCHMVDAYAAVGYALGEEDTGDHFNVENGGVLCYVVERFHEDKKIPDAKVLLKNVDTGETYETTTDELGHFEIMLPEGRYTLTVRAGGYETYEWPDGNNYQNPIVVHNESINYLDDWIKLRRIGKDEIQLSVFAIDSESLEPITDKEITLSLANCELVCKNPQQRIHTSDGSVIFNITMGEKNRLVDSKVVLHIDGYEDYTLDSFQFGNDPSSMHMFDAYFTPIIKTETTTTVTTTTEPPLIIDIRTTSQTATTTASTTTTVTSPRYSSDLTEEQKVFYRFIRDELVPEYGLIDVAHYHKITNLNGIASAVIKDWSDDGQVDMVVLFNEDSRYGNSVLIQLYTLLNGNVELVSEYKTIYGGTDYTVSIADNMIYLSTSNITANFGIMGYSVYEEEIAIEDHQLKLVMNDSGSAGAPPNSNCPEDAILLMKVETANMQPLIEDRVFDIDDYTDLRTYLEVLDKDKPKPTTARRVV